MKRMREEAGRLVGILLALILILSQSVFVPVHADGAQQTETVFTIGEGAVIQAMAGTTFTVPIMVKDCHNFGSLTVLLDYDHTAFELTTVTLHEDLSPKTGALLTTTEAGLANGSFLFEYNPVNAVEDGPWVTLTFTVKEEVMTKDYPIGFIELDWVFSSTVTLDPLGLNSGTVHVTGITGEAEYNNVPYTKIGDALAAAAADPGPDPATVTVLKNITIDKAADKLVIPDDANIQLDLKGKTITADFEDGHLIEVKEGGKLHLTSTGQDRGKFVYEDRPAYSDNAPSGLSFLINEGTLDMSRIEVEGFWQGVVDGLFPTNFYGTGPAPSGTGGQIGLIDDCVFDTVYSALGFGSSTIHTIKDSLILADAMPVSLGLMDFESDLEGSVFFIDRCSILSRRVGSYNPVAPHFGSLFVGRHWGLGRILDSDIGSHEDAEPPPENAELDHGVAVFNAGGIGRITSGSDEGFTRITDPLMALANTGLISRIEGSQTTLIGGAVGLMNMNYGFDDELPAGEIGQIFGGHFEGYLASLINGYDGATGQIGEISGGNFLSPGGWAAVSSGGIYEKISGGCFYGSKEALALATDFGGVFESLTGGYYKSDNNLFSPEENILSAIPPGFGISTYPMDAGPCEDYYHVGEAVAITWKVEDLDDRDDIFILGDPVFYPDPITAPQFMYFRGWTDGQAFFPEGQALPAALVDTVYQAVFSYDQEGPVFTVSSATVTPNENSSTPVSITVSIEDLPLFSSIGLVIPFDEEVKLTEVALHPGLQTDAMPVLTIEDKWPSSWEIKVEHDDSGDMYIENGPFLALTFSVRSDAGNGLHLVKPIISPASWVNSQGEQLGGATFIPGLIEVDATAEALYEGNEYARLLDAIEQAALDGQEAEITVLRNIYFHDNDHRLIIPDGADMTLDMNGKTLTANLEYDYLFEVKAGGKLTLTSSSDKRGRFIYSNRPTYRKSKSGAVTFLLNEGQLDMSKIEVQGFWQGVIDGRFPTTWHEGADTPSGVGGTIASIENCVFDTVMNAIGLGSSTVGIIKDSYFNADAFTLALGDWRADQEGSVLRIENTEIESRRKEALTNYEVEEPRFGGLFLGQGWTLGELEDTRIRATENAPEYTQQYQRVKYMVYNLGQIGTITSTGDIYNRTLITGKDQALYNLGIIDLIDGAQTIIYGDYDPVTNAYDSKLMLAGRIGEIRDGRFWTTLGNGPIRNQAGNESLNLHPTIGKISGGDYSVSSNPQYAIWNQGLVEEITGGRFYGASSALKGWDLATANGPITGGYYRQEQTGEPLLSPYAEAQIPQGYALSTNPMPEGDVHAGYYHIGPAIIVTWKVVDLDDRQDFFIKGDPVYYPLELTPPQGLEFLGWSDGTETYQPEDLPVADESVTYTAVFGNPELDPKDYKVILESETVHANRGDEISVDVRIESETNESFYGTTIYLTYDHEKLTFQGPVAGSLTDGIEIFSFEEDGLTNLKIAGAYLGDDIGYPIQDKRFDLVSLSFKVNADVETGETVVAIRDDEGFAPVVDQLEVFESEVVSQGENLTFYLWNLKVTFKSGDNVNSFEKIAYVKYDQAGLYEDTDYDSNFVPPTPDANSWYTLDEPLWKSEEGENVDYSTIVNEKFTGDATYTANASPSKYDISYDEDFVEILTGVDNDGKVTYLTDVTFKVTANSGYQVKTVTYKVGEGDPVPLEADMNGVYTIAGGNIKGDITIEFAEEVDAKVILHSNDDYHALPSGYQLLELQVSNKLAEGKAYAYKEEGPMFYSPKYSEEDEEFNPDGWHVYLFAIPTKDGEGNAITEADVPALLSIIDGTCEVLDYDYDINQDGRVISTDVVLTYAFYKGVHLYNGFFPATMKVRLNADVNGDRTVDTQDAMKILTYIWDY